MWAPVYDDEWDGDVYLGLDRPPTPGKDSKGEITFKGDVLPWAVGRYEVRMKWFHRGTSGLIVYPYRFATTTMASTMS